jgi:hypothetical protein
MFAPAAIISSRESEAVVGGLHGNFPAPEISGARDLRAGRLRRPAAGEQRQGHGEGAEDREKALHGSSSLFLALRRAACPGASPFILQNPAGFVNGFASFT